MAAITIVMMLTIPGARAQGKLNLTFRPSANFPVNDLGSTEIKSGGGFEVDFSYRFMNTLAAYAGWGWSSFSPKESENIVSHYEENGYCFGLYFIQPVSAGSKLNWHLTAGGVGHHIESENEEGDIIYDTGHGLGWEVGAAISIPVSKRWQLVPGVRYHSLSRNMMNGTVQESIDLNYVSVGVGVSWTLVDM